MTNSTRLLSLDSQETNIDSIKRLIPTLATLLSSAFGSILTVVGTVLLIRMLGADVFGKAALLTSAAIMLGTVTSSGICLHILRISARSAELEKIGTQVWIAVIVSQSIAAVITVSLLIIGLLDDGKYLFQYLLTGLSLHFTTFDAISKNRLVGSQRLMSLAAATILGTISTVGCQLLGAWIYGDQGYMIGFAVGTGLQAASSGLACWIDLPAMGVRPQSIFRQIKDRELLGFVALGTLSACVVPLAHWFNSLIAAHKLNSYGEVATLTVAMQFFNMVIFVPTILNKIVLPHTIKEDITRDVTDSRLETYRQIWKMILYTAPLLPIVWLLSKPITEIYQFKNTDGITVIMFFIGASVLACAAIPLSNYFVSHAKMTRGLVGNFLWALIYLSLAWVLPGGAISSAASLLLAYALNLIIALYLVKKSHHVK